MLAALCKTYGPPETLVLADIPPPVPRAGQVLVAVTAAAVTLGDARIRAARAPAGLSFGLRLAFGLTRPRQPVLGMFLAGRVLTRVPPMPSAPASWATPAWPWAPMPNRPPCPRTACCPSRPA